MSRDSSQNSSLDLPICTLEDRSKAAQCTSDLPVTTVDVVDGRLYLQIHGQVNDTVLRAGMFNQELFPPDYIVRMIETTLTTGKLNENFQQIRQQLHQQGQQLHQQGQQLHQWEQRIFNHFENRFQAMMTQNYELHEYPIPRLFIVLPKSTRRRDMITRPLTKQFRLYFLCDCGEHTIRTGRVNLPHTIHLAKHEGYDLDRPDEFFERYGPYVLTFMKFVKYGMTAAGIIVPPLAHIKIVEGLDAIEKSLKMTSELFGSLSDETINYIQDLQGTRDDVYTTGGPMKLEEIERLEGADLRQLQSYLTVKDKNRELGALNRVFTREGHVKWVCIDHLDQFDHCNENHRKALLKRLRGVIAANKGRFYPKIGAVYIPLGSATVADQFYEILVKAPGVHTLCIMLEWDATLDDLRILASAVDKANITRLTIYGQHFKGPVRDMLNSHRRYKPILDMMANERIESMSLLNFDNLFQKMDISSMRMASRLQHLNLHSESCPYTRQFKSALTKLLEHCPSLVELEIEAESLNEAFEDLILEIPIPPCLEKLTLLKDDDNVEVRISPDKKHS
ncbi:hypothetical protein BGZ65_002475, partial [Modicella reniformis]